MRPTPIPDAEIMDGHQRITVGPPVGSTGIRPVEMLMGPGENDSAQFLFRARFVLDDGDLERLQAGEPFWLTLWSHVVPFDVALAEPTL